MRNKKSRNIRKEAAKILLEKERQQKEEDKPRTTKQIGDVSWINRAGEAYVSTVDFAAFLYKLKSDLQDDLYVGKYTGDEKFRKEGIVKNLRVLIEYLQTFEK